MYTPAHNRDEDRAKLYAFMEEYSFATLVTSKDNEIQATHLPLLIEPDGEALKIVGHMAKANPQWRDFSDRDMLAIFQEPHAFVSTSYYDRFLSVPTWNYVAVHAYGKAQTLDTPEEKLCLLEKTVLRFEGNLDQWHALPDEFKRTKINGIVAFEIAVTRLEARFKLSQDRTDAERERIIVDFRAMDNELTARTGELMLARLEAEHAGAGVSGS
jgi:transcriptional regulator